MSPRPTDPYRPEPPLAVPGVRNLVGLALSGGGIRSATFNLGFLQGLKKRGTLWIFDYLSTVSGGGFIGAWWSAWLSRETHLPPNTFPEPEELEPRRREPTAVLWDMTGSATRVPGLPDGSLSASRDDPIHFVRLFSNYLTPKTGLMSPDTWRLLAYMIRSLLCTWAALLPLLLATVLAAQLFYVITPDSRSAFLCVPSPAVRGNGAAQPHERGTTQSDSSATATDTTAGDTAVATATAVATGTATATATASATANTTPAAKSGTFTAPLFCSPSDRQQSDVHSRTIRLQWLANGLLVAAGVISTLIVLWLIQSTSNPGLALVALAILCGVLGLVGHSWGTSSGWSRLSLFLVSVIATATGFIVRSSRDRERPTDGATVHATPADRRTWLTQQLARVLKLTTLVCIVLVTAGFGHDLMWYLFSGPDSGIALVVKRAGGWGALLLTAASAIYTAVKAAPSTVPGATRPPTALSRWIIPIAPPIVVLVLLLTFALLGHELLVFCLSKSDPTGALSTAAVWLAVVAVLFAMYESYEDRDTPPPTSAFTWRRFVPHAILKLMGQQPPQDQGRPWYYFFSPRGWARLIASCGLAIALRSALSVSPHNIWEAMETGPTNLVALAILALALVLSFSRLNWHITLKSSRPVILLSAACATAVLCLCANLGATWAFLEPAALTALLLIAVLLGGVVALGWLADPNLVSLHGFYKARLARAYLGASNTVRYKDQITDVVPGDDLPLKDLWNHDAGAPYHLINSAMSLVGGSDLATSQRLAENFVMSRYYCGSARTGYRYTVNYMSGKLTLATAAAISGAAVSPTMGSKSPSAALTLLLSLLNVRLGFWAPTPGGKRWYEPHARLWPFYALTETLARTEELDDYCYLTDGGHFDNTGLYALVERGCRYIVVCDCGADPKLGFEDIGTAIRRCRIDFGTEIDLNVNGFATRMNGLGMIHCTAGTIRYQDEHLRMLGLDPADGLGTILWVKPTVTALSSADVRQYGRAHDDFPQQSTADQWYDESQFESYRNLGFDSAIAAFADSPGLAPLPPIQQGQFDTVVDWFERRAGR